MISLSRRPRQVLLIFLCIFSLVLLMITDFRQRQFQSLSSQPRQPTFFYTVKKEAPMSEDGTMSGHVFTYPINIVDACTKGDVELVIPVHSALTNPRRRNMTRHAKQGVFAKDRRNNALLLFFVGMPSMKLVRREELLREIKNESDVYGDIIQVNVADAYHNIAYKSIAVLQWISTYCPNSEFVIKIDDDVHIDPPLLLWSLYRKKKMVKDFILGDLRVNIKPNRSEEVKWHITEEEWPQHTFPPFVPGAAIGYPTSTVKLLHSVAKRTKVIWLDDIFITGICAQKMGIPVFNDSNFVHVHRPMLAPNFVYFD